LVRAAGAEIKVLATERLSPFAFPLWAERLQAQTMSSERWRDRVERMAAQLNRNANRRRGQ
ncbi:MAG: hypothetical protein AAGF46_00620, partial [Pseudomonadota bacterium]